MAQLAFIMLYLALAGALASWVAGAWFYMRTLRALADEGGPTRLTWHAVVVAVLAWPFALGRLKGAAAFDAFAAPPSPLIAEA
ncbi:MAG: hypothetical protein ACJ8EA_06995, partial [Xanthobacteraceae bacterium]